MILLLLLWGVGCSNPTPKIDDPDDLILGEELDQKVREAPGQAKNYLLRARFHLQKERLRAGRQDLEKALELQPDLVPALMLLADLELKERHHEPVIRLTSTVLEKVPDHAEARWTRAHSLQQLWRLREARADLEQLVTRESTAERVAALARVQIELGDYSAALETLGELQEKEAQLQRCRALLFMGRAGEALKIAETFSDSAEFLTLQGAAMEEKGSPSGAFASYTKALELDPELLWARTRRAPLGLRLNQRQAALEDYAFRCRHQPGPEAFLGRSRAAMSLGQKERAQADLNTALVLLSSEGAVPLLEEALSSLAKSEKDWARLAWQELNRRDPKKANAWKKKLKGVL